jgi:hypothetical protein
VGVRIVIVSTGASSPGSGFCLKWRPWYSLARRVSGDGIWVKCTDHKAQTVWVNLDNVTVMSWRDAPQDTEIIFIGGGQVIVHERPENLTKRS